jgi:hypothetical protein
MSPAALISTLELVTEPARNVLIAGLPEHGFEFEGILWIFSTALIVEALKSARGNKSRAAKMLGMKRNLLNYKIGEFQLEPVVEKALQDVKIAEQLQPNLFSKVRHSHSPHSFILSFSRNAEVDRS